MIGLDTLLNGTQSLRRTKTTLIHRKPKNLRCFWWSTSCHASGEECRLRKEVCPIFHFPTELLSLNQFKKGKIREPSFDYLEQPTMGVKIVLEFPTIFFD